MLRNSKQNTDQEQLTSEQKRMIKLSMQSFLSFSTDPADFTQEVNVLIKAFANPLNTNNPYQKVAACFLFSENNLQGIERFNRNITVATVKKFVLNYVTKKLGKAATKAGIELKKTAWRKRKIEKNFITEQNGQQKFISIQLSVAEEIKKPWIDVHDPDDVYQFSLVLDQVTLKTTMSLIIWLPNDSNDTVKMTTFLQRLEGEQLEDEYLTDLIPSAKIKAKKLATEYILNILHADEIITNKEIADAKSDENISELITKKLYLTEIIENRLSILNILDRTPSQASVLADSLSIHLLKNHLCLLIDLLRLEEHNLRVANLFQGMLIKNRLHIMNFHALPKGQISLLVVPIVKILIQSDKLPFEIAKTLPVYLRPLFIKSEYSAYFSKHEINWKLFKDIDQDTCNFLLQPTIISLVINDALTMCRYSTEFRAAIQRKSIHLLISNKIILANQLNDLSLSQIDLIDNQPHFYFWIESGITSTNEVTPHQLDKYYADICAKRLFAIIQSKAFTISDVLDTAKEVVDDLDMLAAHAKIRKSVLMSQILKNLLAFIKQNLLALKTKELTDFEKHFFKKILRTIETKETEQAIEKIYTICSDTTANPDSGLSVSKHKPFVFFKSHTNNITAFCSGFMTTMSKFELYARNKPIQDYGDRINLRKS